MSDGLGESEYINMKDADLKWLKSVMAGKQ
jgi:hypothetical protein